MSAHDQQKGPCRTCDGTGVVETAEQDSRVIHHAPCPECAGPAPGPVTATGPPLGALVHEYGALLAHEEPWQWMPAAEPGERDDVLGAQHARAAMGALRLVQTDTVPTLLDAMRAAEDLLRAVPRRPRCEKGGRSDHVGQHHQTHRT